MGLGECWAWTWPCPLGIVVFYLSFSCLVSRYRETIVFDRSVTCEVTREKIESAGRNRFVKVLGNNCQRRNNLKWR